MTTYHPHRRTPEQRQHDTHQLSAKAQTSYGCVHHDWLTCIAERNNVSRFNAMIMFTKTGNSDGKCACWCHKDTNNQQVTEAIWHRRMVVQAS